jgi:hypothetical protein
LNKTMKQVIFIGATLFVFLNFMRNNDASAWDNHITHKDLSEFAAENSVISKYREDYLKNLGFGKGLDEIFKWGVTQQKVRQWLRAGAELEDAQAPFFPLYGTTRSFNHFHNQLKPWDNAGLNDIWTGKSSLLWAQDGIYQQGFPDGDWSWQKTRLCYYNALTARAENDRQAFFACTFKGLGHQMHLIQDASVPAHVRNDAHPEDAILGKNYWTGDYYFETWAKKNNITINSFASAPVFPMVSLAISYSGYVPMTQFIDTDQYYGGNPSSSSGLELSEYTNANFVSDDTIFTEDRDVNDKHYFPYPRYSANSYEMYEIDQSLITKSGGA